MFSSLSMIVSSLAGGSAVDATDNSEANSTPLGIYSANVQLVVCSSYLLCVITAALVMFERCL